MDFVLTLSRYALPILAVIILALCSVALLRRKPQSLGEVMLVNTINGDCFELISREASIGRHKSCDIILNYPSVSRQHAVITCGKDAWYIRTIKQDSPVRVNSKEVEKKQMLKTGDKIRLGEVTLVFQNNVIKTVKNPEPRRKNNGK